MGILSPAALILFLLFAVASFVLLITYWRKLARRSPKTIALRILALFTCNLLIVLSLGLALNDYGTFYSSWSELFGIQTVEPSITEAQVNPISKLDIASGITNSDGSVLLRQAITGDQSKVVATILTLLPPDYVQGVLSGKGQDSNTVFHVIELLPGYPGSPTTWIRGMNVESYLQQARVAGTLSHAIIVIPQMNILPHKDTECLDVPNGPQVETWLAKDVVSYEKKFLGIGNRRWGVAGYSTGGWCSAMLTLKNPNQYIAGAPIAGYFEPKFATAFPPKSLAEMTKRYDIKSIAFLAPPAVQMLFVNSTKDRTTNVETQKFVALMRKPIKTSVITLVGAGHNLKAWTKVEPALFRWFGDVFKASENPYVPNKPTSTTH